MAFGNTVEDLGSIPIAATYVPGVGFIALQGSTLTNTDGSSNVSSPVNLNVTQIGTLAVQMAGSDGATSTHLLLLAPGLYNGATHDQQRGNLDNITVLASAAHTTAQTSADMTNYNHKGIIVVLNVSAGTTPSLTLEVDGKDPVSSAYYSLLTASAAVAATGTFVYMVYPGASTTVTNTGVTQSSGMVLPRTWRVKVSVGNSNSITYSVAASLIV